jgi:hypothetical protein
VKPFHTLLSALFAPGHVRVRDHIAWSITRRSALVRRLRGWWRDRDGRPGFRMEDYR